MGGGDEVSYGAVGSRREGGTPCATRRVSTARAREKPGRRATSPAAGARSADPVDTARRQIRARASSDPSRRASRGFDRSRERHGRSADLTAPRRTYDGGAVVRHDRHGDRVSSRPVALRARVSNDAPPGLVLKTFQVTRKTILPGKCHFRLCGVWTGTRFRRAFLAAASLLPARPVRRGGVLVDLRDLRLAPPAPSLVRACHAPLLLDGARARSGEAASRSGARRRGFLRSARRTRSLGLRGRSATRGRDARDTANALATQSGDA